MKLDNSNRDADGKLKNGVFQEHYKDGALACIGKYRDGEKVGVWKYLIKTTKHKSKQEKL